MFRGTCFETTHVTFLVEHGWVLNVRNIIWFGFSNGHPMSSGPFDRPPFFEEAYFENPPPPFLPHGLELARGTRFRSQLAPAHHATGSGGLGPQGSQKITPVHINMEPEKGGQGLVGWTTRALFEHRSMESGWGRCKACLGIAALSGWCPFTFQRGFQLLQSSRSQISGLTTWLCHACQGQSILPLRLMVESHDMVNLLRISGEPLKDFRPHL